MVTDAQQDILDKARRGLPWVEGPSNFDAREGFDPQVLWAFLSPDFDAGLLLWRRRSEALFADSLSKKITSSMLAAAWNAKHAGKHALCRPRPDGYMSGRIMGRHYLAHRVMYALAYGRWPCGEVDHINGDRSDNRPENLRDVSKSQNQRNARISSANTSGATGVAQIKKNGRWYARARVDGKNQYIGFFDTFEEAVKARKAADAVLGYHPNHGRTA